MGLGGTAVFVVGIMAIFSAAHGGRNEISQDVTAAIANQATDQGPEPISIGPSPAYKAPVIEVVRSWPRLKPKRREANASVGAPLIPGAPIRTTARRSSVAADEDFTGGRNSLFSAYTRDQSRARQDKEYETLVLPKGIGVAEALLALSGPSADVGELVSAASSVADLDGLEPGTAVEFAFETVFVPTPIPDPSAQGESGGSSISFVSARRVLARIRFRPEDRKVVTAWRQSDGSYTAQVETLDVETHHAAVAGVIRHSLFAAAFRADVPPEVMTKFANLFLYDVDFARDIHEGDKFEAVYEVFYDTDGNYVGTGDVLFAAMTWRGGRGSRAYYRFDEAGFDEAPYFDAHGESATRLLMKTPIEGAKVTSGFGKRRHPILGYSKTHKGVDFGASRGTPIMAAGDGTIERAAPTGTFGNYVKIQHAHGYATAYAHMQRFAPGIAAGAKVRQGQIIGYVGSTGRSTGPHLHYEVLLNNKVQNPMTLKVANGRTLDDARMTAFAEKRNIVNGVRLHPLTVAMADPASDAD